jgi:DnaJ-class molecular chaperone
VLGGKVNVPTPTGAVTMTVPKGANTGTTMRLRGKGAPKVGGGHGDEFVKLKVVLPKGPDPALEAFVSEWDRKGFNPREAASAAMTRYPCAIPRTRGASRAAGRPDAG